MADIGQRGKWAEAQVRAWMKKRSDADARFDFYRYPDARAGSFATVPADFEVVHQCVAYLLEVKQVEVTDQKLASRRLPAKNFSADKVARMAKRQMAGAECWVLVCFMPMKEWRLVALDVFTVRESSWDLKNQPAFASAREAMENIYGLP